MFIRYIVYHLEELFFFIIVPTCIFYVRPRGNYTRTNTDALFYYTSRSGYQSIMMAIPIDLLVSNAPAPYELKPFISLCNKNNRKKSA